MSLETLSDMSANERTEEPATMPVALVQHRPAPLLIRIPDDSRALLDVCAGCAIGESVG